MLQMLFAENKSVIERQEAHKLVQYRQASVPNLRLDEQYSKKFSQRSILLVNQLRPMANDRYYKNLKTIDNNIIISPSRRTGYHPNYWAPNIRIILFGYIGTNAKLK